MSDNSDAEHTAGLLAERIFIYPAAGDNLDVKFEIEHHPIRVIGRETGSAFKTAQSF